MSRFTGIAPLLAAIVVAAGLAHVPATAAGYEEADFDGDGKADVAIGVAGYNYASGAVFVAYANGGKQNLAAAPGAGGFGEATASCNLNGDGYADLVVGDPRRIDDGGISGGITTYLGSATGLGKPTHLNQDTPNVPDQSENDDQFGTAIACGDLTGDGKDEVAVGAPSENLPDPDDGAQRTGAVFVFKGSSTGVATTGVQMFSQDSANVPDLAEDEDEFGYALAIGDVTGDKRGDLAIGAPGENLGAGAITLLEGSAAGLTGAGSTLVVPASAGVKGRAGHTLAIGNVGGDAYSDVIAGAPNDEDGGQEGAGSVIVLGGAAAGIDKARVQVVGQSTVNVVGDPLANDAFGTVVDAGDVTKDGLADVLVGVPGKTIGTLAFAGSAVLLRGSPAGLAGAGSQEWQQNTRNVADTAEAGDSFGAAAALLDLNGDNLLDAVIGAPDEDLGSAQDAGLASRFDGSGAGLGSTAGVYTATWFGFAPTTAADRLGAAVGR
jgi:hypothetical protein